MLKKNLFNKPRKNVQEVVIIGREDQLIEYQKIYKKCKAIEESNIKKYFENEKKWIQFGSIEGLNEISCGSLSVGTKSEGNFIRVKLIRPSFKLNSCINGIGQDLEQKLIQFSIYNYPEENQYYGDVFNEGKKVIFIDPFLTVTGSGKVFLKVQNLTKIFIENVLEQLEEIDMKKKEQQFEIIKEEAKKLIKMQEYLQAYILYSKAIEEVSQPQRKACLILNKAIVSNLLNLKDEYLENSSKAFDLDPKNLKASYHKVKALALKRQFQKSKSLLAQIEMNETEKKNLEQFIKEEEQNSKGKFFWYKIFKENKIGEYCSQKLEVRKSKFGLGVFTNNRIQAGQFILVERPFILTKVKKTPEYHQTGSQQEKEQIETYYKQSPQVRQLISSLCTLTNFTKQISERKEEQLSLDKVVQKFKVNSQSINEIQVFLDEGISSETKEVQMNGLYSMGSFINHRCEQNCAYFHLNNSVVFYACSTIEKDEELFFSYFNCSNLSERTQALKNNWGIQNCECSFCQESKYYIQNLIPPAPVKSKNLKKALDLPIIFQKRQLCFAYYQFCNLRELETIFQIFVFLKDEQQSINKFKDFFDMTKAEAIKIFNLIKQKVPKENLQMAEIAMISSLNPYNLIAGSLIEISPIIKRDISQIQKIYAMQPVIQEAFKDKKAMEKFFQRNKLKN